MKKNTSSDSNTTSDVMRSRVRKGQVQVVKFSLASSDKKKQQESAVVVDDDDDDDYDYASDSIEYEIGDMVWGKVKSHPWWPGYIYNPVFASPNIPIPIHGGGGGLLLVAFFGDGSYGWFHPAHLLPFHSHFSHKSNQTTSRTFLKAVEEAVHEATRRSALPFTCPCTTPSEIQDIGTVYSAHQIIKARDNFKPREMVAFLNQLATGGGANQDPGTIEYMENKAKLIAYRKAIYQQLDDTYAQAFGHLPDVRTSLKKMLGTPHSPKVPIRAPLSGPLVIAEALGKGKGFAKHNKGKVQAKKDQYLFKRRDEANEFKSSVQIDPNPVTSSEQPVYIEDSSAKVKYDYVLQKSSPSVSTEHMVQEKEESTEMRSESHASDASEAPASEGIIMEDKFAAVEVGTAGIQVESSKAESPSKSLVDQDPGKLSHPLKARPSFDKAKNEEMKNKGSLVSNVEVGLTSQNFLKMTGEMPHTSGCSAVISDIKDDHPGSSVSEDFKLSLSQPAKSELHDSFSAAHVSETTNADFRGKDKNIRSDIGEKKLRIHKRAVGELNRVSTITENKKKKPKEESTGSQNMQMHPSGGNNGSSVDSVAEKYVCTPAASRDSQADPQKKEDIVNYFSLNSFAAQKTSKTENIKLKLPQMLYNLKTLAINPFHRSESSPTGIRQIVLRFRSLVFQKSLAPLPPANSESKETRRSKPAAAVATNNVSAENVRELKSVKLQKLVVRPDDPAKGGRKRGPSDRQEEIAAKRKKIIDAKLLTDPRTAEKSSLMQRGEVKETNAVTMKSVKPELVKKVEPLSKASDPTMLVMKFPLHGTLPSINELKARFIRFGQLDHSACRVFWKSLTCRVVFRHKVDAQAAYKYAAASNNMFGTTGVRCYLREMEVAAIEQESGKVPQDEVSMSTSQLRDSTVERRFAAPLASQTVKQSEAQVRSILKRATGDETSVNGGFRGISRVNFTLGGEENSEGAEQLMIGNKNSTNAIFGYGGTSTSHANDFNSKNFQNITSSLLPPLLPTPTGAVQFPGPGQSNLQYTEEAPRTNHNFNIPTTDLMTPSTPYIDISEQMINLLKECNDIVNNVTAFLGYVPFHPL